MSFPAFLARLFRRPIVVRAVVPLSDEEFTEVIGGMHPSNLHYRAFTQLLEEQEEDALAGAIAEVGVTNAAMNTHRIVGYVASLATLRSIREEMENRREVVRERNGGPDARK